MWSSGSIGLEKVDVVLESRPPFQPSPYTFTKLEKGKKKATDASCISPPGWLLLDHTIAVIWSIFNLDPKLQPLSIDDLKWAYEFLKEIKNQKGANPPDVKVCLKEIEDRLIHLYSKLTSPESENFREQEVTLSKEVFEKSSPSFTSYFSKDLETKLDSLSLSPKNSLSPPMQKISSRHIKIPEKEEPIPLEEFPFLEEDSDWCEEEMDHNEEVEEYVLRLFENEKKEEALQAKNATKSLIPTIKKKKVPTVSPAVSGEGATKKQKTSKKVHCIAQMRSLQFQKSMKVKHTNGEEAYSKLKAEILTIKPNTSKEAVMKILKEWRSEQVHNQHKKVHCLEEYMKTVNRELKPTFQINSSGGLKDLDKEKGFRTRRWIS